MLERPLTVMLDNASPYRGSVLTFGYVNERDSDQPQLSSMQPEPNSDITDRASQMWQLYLPTIYLSCNARDATCDLPEIPSLNIKKSL